MHPVRKMILTEIPNDKRIGLYNLIMERKRKSLSLVLSLFACMIISFIPPVIYVKSQLPNMGIFLEGYVVGGLVAGITVLSILYTSLGRNYRPPTDKEKKELEEIA